MKKYFTNMWVKYMFFLVIINLIGWVGFLLPYGNEKWNFIFENMIWLPFELLLTIFAINKIFESLEERKNRKRFVRVAGKRVDHLIDFIKRKVVAIPINCQYHDSTRDEIALYDEIIENPKKYFDETLFTSTREFLFSSNNKVEYNYMGIAHLQCLEIDSKLRKFIERYELYFDDDLFELISNFEIVNHSFGILDNTSGIGFTNYVQGDYSQLQKSAIEFVDESNRLIQLLSKYKTNK
ncbi:hypothetical protein IW492_05965 [Enterococcus sp. BWB1-3]|uniref:hypothetical protein n=1 Tax=Enterococcus sp. BWB1-3 TaxID=2787713 RepID=UPI0019226F22|nr:hypothetical protein [Enterococcus sp. BWB1-3]MBL1228778.1 hypothetical protein [Enterococcus sp. BWB1-3]